MLPLVSLEWEDLDIEPTVAASISDVCGTRNQSDSAPVSEYHSPIALPLTPTVPSAITRGRDRAIRRHEGKSREESLPAAARRSPPIDKPSDYQSMACNCGTPLTKGESESSPDPPSESRPPASAPRRISPTAIEPVVSSEGRLPVSNIPVLKTPLSFSLSIPHLALFPPRLPQQWSTSLAQNACSQTTPPTSPAPVLSNRTVGCQVHAKATPSVEAAEFNDQVRIFEGRFKALKEDLNSKRNLVDSERVILSKTKILVQSLLDSLPPGAYNPAARELANLLDIPQMAPSPTSQAAFIKPAPVVRLR